MFLGFGAVASTTIIKDKFSINTMRFGLVDMPNDSEAKIAIDKLNGSRINGRRLTVHKARLRSKDRRNDGRGGGRRKDDEPENGK